MNKFDKKLGEMQEKRKNMDAYQTSYSKEDNQFKTDLEENIKKFQEVFENDNTIHYRIFQNQKSLKGCAIYVESMVDHPILNEHVIEPLINNKLTGLSRKNYLEEMKTKVLAAADVHLCGDLDLAVDSILRGEVVVLLDGHDHVLIVCSKGMETRPIAEPKADRVVRGPRDGFTESIHVNLTLIRRRVVDPNLKFQIKYIGKVTKTKVCVCYIKNIANIKIVDELIKRVEEINIDGIVDSGSIQEMIKDSPYSPFHTVGYTERPDSVVSKLLEGRVALVVDGSPFVLTVPFLFTENFQSSEDYYDNFIFASFNRILRKFGSFLALFVPAIYNSLVTFHQEMLPTPLLLSIAAGRADVPLPSVIEIFLMLIVFEIIREAGARMPISIGQTVSIVGALVLGQAVVDAKIIAPSVIIIVALTGISALLCGKIQGSILMLRFILLILSGIIGIYGVLIGSIGLVIHLMGIRSFGVPYMLTEGSLKFNDLKDASIRAPWWYLQYRPQLIALKNRRRGSTAMRKGKGK